PPHLLLFHMHLTALLHVLLYVLIIRHPPTSTLFPYTTLFRSHHNAEINLLLVPLEREIRPPPEKITVPPAPPVPPPRRDRRIKLDRKSTRLNSSHQIISYAVVCLKKKARSRPDGAAHHVEAPL